MLDRYYNCAKQNKSDITLSDFLFNEINLTELSEITADKNIEITKIKTQFRNLLDNFFSSLKKIGIQV